MSYRIEEVEGIGPSYGEKLAAVEIKTTADFLKHCANAKGRDATKEATGISRKLLLKWANLSDLMRISGIGPQFSELLEASGVDTVKELRHRRADNLAAKMAEVMAEKKLTRASPAESVVQGWIDAAKATEPTITH